MSMNKTCPISNFTPEECSEGMKSLLAEDSRFNEPIPIHDIAFTDRKLLNTAPLQFGEKIAQIHEAEMRKRLRAGNFTTRGHAPPLIVGADLAASELFELEFRFGFFPRNERFAGVLRDSCFEIAQVFKIFNAFLKSNDGLIERLDLFENGGFSHKLSFGP